MKNIRIWQVLSAFTLTMFIYNSASAEISYFTGSEFAHDLGNNTAGPKMIVVPTGSFVTEGGYPSRDDSLGKVIFEKSFAISQTEITRAQFRQYLMDAKSSELRNLPTSTDEDNLPINATTWSDAVGYARWLSSKTGFQYRLPTASEWEYAARAGSKRIYSWGDQIGKNLANCKECGAKTWNGSALPPMTFPANDWNIFDMQGNLWEWTRDCMDPSAPPLNGSAKLFGNCEFRELRSGSAQSDGWSIRISSRAFGKKEMRSKDIGIRVVMDLPQ